MRLRPCGGPQVKLVLASDQTLARGGLQDLQLDVIVNRPDVLDVPRPRREEYTICTAVAPAAVFTVRTYGDKCPLYEPG
jgi:hypothetical protein